MLLTKLRVLNNQGSILNLPLDTHENGFLVTDITGLGPVKATLVSSSYANLDGAQYQTARREPRNIVIKLGLDPDYSSMSVFDLRSQLYKFLMPKTKAKLFFDLFDKFSTSIIDQNLNVEIEARIESLEPDMFTNEPAVDLSLMCYDPEFVDPEPVIFEGETVNDLTETTLEYKGTVETGFIFRLLPDRPMSEFAIYFKTPDDMLHTVHFEHDLFASDTVEISSIFGSKHVILKQNGIESHVLFALSAQSNWLELFHGDNNFRVYAEGDPVPFSIEYTNKYGGL